MGIATAICSVALILLADTSSSIHDTEYYMMRDGHAAAFRSPEVGQAIRDSEGIAIAYMEFDSTSNVRIQWRILRTIEDANKYADDIANLPRTSGGYTATGDALLAAVNAFETTPCQPEKRIIDIVTDGDQNYGSALPEAARDTAIQRLIRINGLGVASNPTNDPSAFLEDRVVTPVMRTREDFSIPRGFVIRIRAWADFAQAIRGKISLELAQAVDNIIQYAERR